MRAQTNKFLSLTAALGLLTACSGSGVSTTARDTFDDPMMTGASGDTGSSASDSNDEDDSDPGETGEDPSAGETDDSDSDDSASDSDSDTASASDTNDTSPGTDTGTPGDGTIEGSWVSEGADIAPILVELTMAQRIDATFTGDTFTVRTVDADSQEVEQTGVFAASESGFGDIMEITLEQSAPTAITVEGIFEVDTSVDPPILRYEVVQTMPSVGAVPPTAEGGFGSTAYGADLTQIFVKQ